MFSMPSMVILPSAVFQTIQFFMDFMPSMVNQFSFWLLTKARMVSIS
jgi:hypothetical protein